MFCPIVMEQKLCGLEIEIELHKNDDLRVLIFDKVKKCAKITVVFCHLCYTMIEKLLIISKNVSRIVQKW